VARADALEEVMNMDPISIRFGSIVVFFLFMGCGRVLSERALGRLSAEEKVRLMDGFSSYRAVTWVPAVVLAVAVHALLLRWPAYAEEILLLEVGAVLGILMAAHALTLRRLRRMALPDIYVKRLIAARLLTLTGTVLLFASIMYQATEPLR
jgi:hypothetical protein